MEAENEKEEKILISAAAKKLADENGIDVSEVVGTGKNGNISKSDIEGLINDKGEWYNQISSS